MRQEHLEMHILRVEIMIKHVICTTSILDTLNMTKMPPKFIMTYFVSASTT